MTTSAKPLAMRSVGAIGPGNLPVLKSVLPSLPAEAAEAGAVVGAEVAEANALRYSRNLTRTRTVSSTKPSASRHANTFSISGAAAEKTAGVHVAADPKDLMTTVAADPKDLTVTAGADPQGRMVPGGDSLLAQTIRATVKSRHVIFRKPSGLLPRTKSRRKKGFTTKEHCVRCLL